MPYWEVNYLSHLSENFSSSCTISIKLLKVSIADSSVFFPVNITVSFEFCLCLWTALDSVLLGYLLIRHLTGEDVAMCFTIFTLDVLIHISKNGHTSVEAVDIWFQTEIVLHSNCVFSGKETAFPTPASQQKTVLSLDFFAGKKILASLDFCTFFVRLNLSQLLSCFMNLWA